MALLLLLNMKHTINRNNIPNAPLPRLSHCVDVIIYEWLIGQNSH
jgi:hypothetical protein